MEKSRIALLGCIGFLSAMIITARYFEFEGFLFFAIGSVISAIYYFKLEK